MTIWCGQDGSLHDSDGDGPATLDDDEEIATTGEFAGWTEPFTDWNGELLEGMGQYYVWNITDPWEPADFPAIPFPPASSDFAPEPPPPAASAQPESPLDTPAAPHAPTPPHFGPPGPGTKRPRPGGAPSHHTPGIAARGTFAGFDFPFTDDNGHLLMDPHPSHRDWQAPMTYGPPVMTGWDTPLTDLEGQLLSGPGQYGTFTVENPYDHRTFNDVDLHSEQLEGNPLYYYTDANMAWPSEEDGHVIVGDDASQFGQAFGSMLGTAAGDNSGSWGQAGASIASSIEQGSDSGDWGSAIASIAATTAKVAIPAIVKATQSSSSSSSATAPSVSPPSVSPSGTTATTPSTTTATPAQTQKGGAQSRSGPGQRNAARWQLIALIQKLAKQYGIPVGRTMVPPPQQAQHQAQGTFA